MSGYDVEITAVRKAGQAMTSVGEQARAVDLAAPLDEMATAMPGSRATQVATGVARRWRDKIAGWGDKAITLGGSVVSAADAYVARDEVARTNLLSAARDRAEAV